MRIYTIPLVLVILSFSCSKDDERILLETQEFEMDECFSALSLSGAEVVITDEQSYIEFQDSIRRHFNSSCDTVHLPKINFNESLFLGKFTQTSGCSAEYNRLVYYNDKNSQYEYEILVSQFGDCAMLISSFNCVIVPKQSESEEVTFKVTLN